jgi:hypothetical protein
MRLITDPQFIDITSTPISLANKQTCYAEIPQRAN